MIKYYLQTNPVTTDPNDRSARVKHNATLDLQDIVERATKRGTSLTETDLNGAAKLLFEVITDEVADGNNVVLPLAVIRPGIKGVFTSASDSFDSSRHVKRATIAAGTLLNEKMQAAQVEKTTGEAPSPELIEFKDVNSGTTNSLLSPGGIGIITGEELKFNPENSDEGIWFVPVAEGDAVRVSVIASRTEGKLVFSIPAELQTGYYTLEVRKGYGSAASLRTGSLDEKLQVS